MEQPQKVDGDSMIRSGIRNCRLTSGNVSFEKEEMKQRGCLGIHSEVAGLGLKGRYAKSKN